MAVTTRRIAACPDDVFAVLADGWSYGHWVVGTKRIRSVDAGWPAPGTRVHYSAGLGPLTFDDVTIARGGEPGRELDLEARGWPAGYVGIRLRLEDQDGASVVSLDERPSRGLVRRLHNPLFDLVTKVRNTLTLRRLGGLAERRRVSS